MSFVCAHTMHGISQWKHVQRQRKLNNSHPRVEVFGIDLLMDDKFKIYVMEANTQVGLLASPDTFPDESCRDKDCCKNGCTSCKGVKNPTAKESNRVTEKVVDATLDVLQLDCEQQDLSKTLINLHEIIKNDL